MNMKHFLPCYPFHPTAVQRVSSILPLITPETLAVGGPSRQTLVCIATVYELRYGLLYSAGPKGYVATPDIFDEGSTALHCDITSAVNILLYCGDPGGNGANWVIFWREDITPLRKYLESRFPEQDTDVIHGLRIFLTETHLRELRDQNVIPFRFTQKQGEAVFINAGCAHQVRLLQVHTL